MQSHRHRRHVRTRYIYIYVRPRARVAPGRRGGERRGVMQLDDTSNTVREPPEPEAEAELPPYCCAILCDRQQTAEGTTSRRIFVEQRGVNADVAANTLTCWGGKREPSEAPLECVVRECTEEMAWAPDVDLLGRACDL